MDWFKLLLGLVKLAAGLLSQIERGQLISEGERRQRLADLEEAYGELAEAAQAGAEWKALSPKARAAASRGWYRD